MLLRFYRMLAAFTVVVLVALLAPATAFAIDATITNSSDATEGGTATFTITLDSAPASDVRVNYDVSGTAVVSDDYQNTLNGFVTFNSVTTTQTINVITVDDNLSEVDESVIITLTSTDNASVEIGTPNTATITITDDDVPTVSIQPLNNMSEGGFTLGQFRFITSNNVVGGLTINYSYSGTADYGADGDYYDDVNTINNTITIAETDSDGIVDVSLTVVQDFDAEGLETVIATINSLSFADGIIDPDNTSATITLASNDTVDVSINAGSQGTEDGNNATFVVGLSATASTPIEVGYFDNASTADNSTDYTPPSGTVTIPAGSLSAQINIPILNDTDEDAGETIVIDLDRVISGPAVIISPSSASSVIVDNDQSLVSISAGTNGSEAAADNASFTVSLDQASTDNITVTINTAGTVSGADYNLTPAMPLLFSPGETSKTIYYNVEHDDIAEGTETIIASIGTIVGPAAAGSPNSATRLIIDNDTARLSVDPVTLTAVEQTLTDRSFVIRTSALSSNDITVSFTLGGTAAETQDYAAVTKSVTIPAMTATETVLIDVLNDTNAEDNETVILSLQSVTAGSAVISSDDTATMTIEDNDTVNVFLGTTTDTDEDNATADGIFNIETSAAAQAPITVLYSLSGTADNNTDYTGLSGSLTIPSGSTATTLAIDSIDDSTVEGDETVQLTLISVDSGPGVVTGSSRSLTIGDNDNASLSITAVSNGGEPSTPGQFRVSTELTNHGGIVVDISVSGTVTSSDYSAPSSVTIPNGVDNATFNISINDDNLVEDNETLTVTLDTVTTGTVVIGSNDNASITVTSDDVATVSFAGDNTTQEGDGVTGNLHLNLSHLSEVPLTVSYTVGGTATSGSDFTALSGSTIVPVNTRNHALPISIINDSTYEDNETVTISIDSITGSSAIGTPDNATLTITNDDNVTLSIAAGDNPNEDTTPGQFIFSLTEDVDEDVIFVYSVVSGSTDAVPSDYSFSLPSPLTIPADDDNITLVVTAVNDNLVEGNEALTLQIDSITSGPAVVAGSNTATMTLIDNDTLSVQLTTPHHGDEDGPDNASVTLSLSNTATAGDVVVGYTVGGTATSGSDYTALSGSITIDNGTSSKVLNIPVIDDNLDEDNETVIITLSSVSAGAALSLTNNSLSVSIEDNDNSSISITTADTVDEGDSAVFAVMLSTPAGATTTISYTDNGTATSGTDYTAPSGTLVIAAGASQGSISVPIINDGVADDNETLSLTITSVTGPVTLTGTPTASTSILDVTDYEAMLKKAAAATRKMIREDLSISLDNARRTTRTLTRGAVDRLSNENAHDYTDNCEHDDSPKTDVNVEGDDRSIDGYGRYREVKRKCYSNDVTIASVDFSFADDGKGNETGTFSGVWASETTNPDLYGKYGTYIEVSVRNREQTKKDKGEIDTVRVNFGGYMAYRTAASSFLSSYITVGISQSTYDLTYDNIIKSSGDFLAYNAGTGVGFTGEMKRGYVKFSPNFSFDIFATGYQTFKGDFKVDGDIYKRDIEQSILHKATFSVEPLMRIYSSKVFAEASSVTTIAPSIFCTASNDDTDCGYSLLAENVTRDLFGTDFTTRLSYESVGDLTTTSLSLKANSHLFGNKFIRLANEVSAKQETRSTSSSATTPSSGGTTVTSDPYLSYKVYIEMLY